MNYSPGRLEGIDPKLSTTIKELWDRVNWLVAAVAGLGGANGTGVEARAASPLLPVAPDDLVSPGTVPGPIVGGTENWGANLITIPALAFSLNKDQANFRSLIFQHAVSGAKTINMPYLPGKMWLVLNGLSVDSIAFLPPGGGPGSTVAGGRNGIIVMNRLSNGVVVISKMAPDSP